MPGPRLRAPLLSSCVQVPSQEAFDEFSVGLGGVVSTDVRLALSGLGLQGYTVVAGLGGRAITKASLARMLREAVADQLQPLTFLDLDWRIVNRQLERERAVRRSGPIAENLLRDVGTVASKVS